ncbi:MAG: hypothetical protein A2664_03190 [Candidatus Taylorbacteria bacterium RIFCSPHIGHO2_01_FULL_46_22b]|uniref:Uncharacterized protein n=1 Tax=Candidatus Taylorbacteria bacterium RIFCSPHIGHO2_01_FULL_46_22b TaxID=1802301 RepID=A0A1G2M419_9BACT|nr:MAG: hypothetical protein A2664_03190 [Candidatus Taylorbacteria bacterium RIFCSPHIGHO2_01_FULL_46_22b]
MLKAFTASPQSPFFVFSSAHVLQLLPNQPLLAPDISHTQNIHDGEGGVLRKMRKSKNAFHLVRDVSGGCRYDLSLIAFVLP